MFRVVMVTVVMRVFSVVMVTCCYVSCCHGNCCNEGVQCFHGHKLLCFVLSW